MMSLTGVRNGHRPGVRNTKAKVGFFVVLDIEIWVHVKVKIRVSTFGVLQKMILDLLLDLDPLLRLNINFNFLIFFYSYNIYIYED